MAWFKVDDGFPTHRKVLAIPRGKRRLAAIGAWTLTGAWSAANGTEGRIPAHIIEEFGIPRSVVDDLVMSGLWHGDHNTGDARQMHDFLDYNPSAEQVAADREASRERQRRARERRRQQAEAAADRAHLREVRT